MTPATELKRKELQIFIERVLAPQPAVQAVVGIGSIATGNMRHDSDIDVVVFFDPMDWYIIPAEFYWLPFDGTFHTIFTEDDKVRSEAIQIDALRLELRIWADSRFHWPEPRRAELVNGWIAFDRNKEVTRLIAHRTAYSETLRQKRLDEAITWMDQHLGGDGPQKRWDSLPPPLAHDRLQAAYQSLVRALFAFNRQWLPWRDRQMDGLLGLSWLPKDFAERVAVAANAPGLDFDGYMARVNELRSLFEELLEKVVEEGIYSTAPIDQAFIRSHDEPGYAWNMDDWNAENLRRALEKLSGEDEDE